MYVESKPNHLHGESRIRPHHSPHSKHPFKHRPVLKTGTSSSSSLSGMEQAIPSFKSFVSRTPPPNQHKPLPPTPLRPSRPTTPASATNMAYSSNSNSRRSSSVYSRASNEDKFTPNTTSHVFSWRTADLADDCPSPPQLFRSTSADHVATRIMHADARLTRPFEPLLSTPSPMHSPMEFFPIDKEPRPSILLPPPPQMARIAKKHLRTVSLEQAQETVLFSGAVHLLPEEMRAQVVGKARSYEVLRASSNVAFAGTEGKDWAGRDSSDGVYTESLYPRPTLTGSLATTTFKNSLEHLSAPLAGQHRKQSRAKAIQALGMEEADEPRGRARTRGPRHQSYGHYLPKPKRRLDDSNISTALQSDCLAIAHEYHNLLSEQYRAPSDLPASDRTRSDSEVKAQMKLVPQPLFHSKPPAKLPPADKASSTTVIDRTDSVFTSASSYGAGRESHPFPLRVSTTSTESAFGRHRRSTSGSIPISPPMDSMGATFDRPWQVQRMSTVDTLYPADDQNHHRQVSVEHRQPPAPVGKKSAFQLSFKHKKPDATIEQFPKPLLAADIIALRDKNAAFDDFTPSSPTENHDQYFVHDDPTLSVQNAAKAMPKRKESVRLRMIKGAARYADKLSRTSHTAEDLRRNSSTLVSPESPHLLPSPTKFRFQHVLAPARPLDERHTGVAVDEEESVTANKGKLGELLHSVKMRRKVHGSEKRRGEIKRMIRVVGPSSTGRDDDAGVHWMM